MDLYAYCLADNVELTAAAIEGAAGIGGAAPHLIQCDGMVAVTGEFNGNRVEVTRDNVYAHERVISLVNAVTSPLPFRFGTVVTAAQLSVYVESNRESLIGLFERVRGSVEMSVKVICRREPGSEPIEHESDAVAGEVMGKGARFLEAKRAELSKSDSMKERAEEIGAWLAQRVSEAVRESVVRLRPSTGLAVAAAHLVARERLGDYRDRLSGARRERPDLHFLTSGPWAPYSFVGLPVVSLDRF
jgi:hypothetical protein